MTLPFNVISAGKIVAAVRSDDTFSNTKIMVGGLTLNQTVELWRSLGADGTASNAEEAVTLARQWLEEQGGNDSAHA